MASYKVSCVHRFESQNLIAYYVSKEKFIGTVKGSKGLSSFFYLSYFCVLDFYVTCNVR